MRNPRITADASELSPAVLHLLPKALGAQGSLA